MLFRRLLLETTLPFPPNIYYDWWLAANACSVGNIECVNEILVWHRMHQSNATGTAKPKIYFKEQTRSTLSTVLSIPDIPVHDWQLGMHLLKKYQQFDGRFSWPVFWLLFTNAPILFAHKRRVFPWISYLKHSWRYARASTLA